MLASGRVEFLPSSRVRSGTGRSSRGSPAERLEVPRALPDRRRALPRPRHPGADAAAVRGRGRGPRHPGQRARPARGGPEPVRHRGVGQDRHRRLRLAARAAASTRTRSAGCGPATRGCSTARSSSPTRPCSSAWPPTPCGRRPTADVAGRPLPAAGGRGDHAAHRPRRSRRRWPRHRRWRTWELDLLRSIEDVVRLGHVRRVEPGRLALDDGDGRRSPSDAVVVHCAASGLRYPPLVPIWGPSAITLQPIRAGFPCFGAALAGYVEATRDGRRREEPAVPADAVLEHAGRLGDDDTSWAPGAACRSGPSPTSRPGPTASPLNPARDPARARAARAALDDALARLQTHAVPGWPGSPS